MSQRKGKASKRKQELVNRNVSANIKIHKSSHEAIATTSKKTGMSVSTSSSRDLVKSGSASSCAITTESSDTPNGIVAELFPKEKASAMILVKGGGIQKTMEQFLCPATSESSNSSHIDLQSVNAIIENVDEFENFLDEEISGSHVERSDCTRKLQKKNSFMMPSWMQKYFRYDGHVIGSGNQRGTVQMTCVLCASDPESKNKSGEVLGTPFYNFKRHAKTVHPKMFMKEDQTVVGKIQLFTNVGSNIQRSFFESTNWTSPTNKDAFLMSHPIQSRFVKDLMDCVAIDLLPLDFIERPSFIKLIRNLNKSIRIFSRRTIGRRLKNAFEQEVKQTFFTFYKFKLKIKKIIKNLVPGSFHLILDMWTDRSKNSVLGIKCQFISDDWKIHNLVLGFRHFPDHHTGAAIRKIFDEVLKETFQVDSSKIGVAVGDNASNVNTAFAKETDCEPVTEATVSLDDEEWEDFEEFFEGDVESNTNENESLGEDIYADVQRNLDLWAKLEVPKLPCYCHLLQLIIKDALENSQFAEVVKDVKKVKAFFHRSPYWYNKFKAEAGKSLVNQADTRWNTVYYVFSRLIEAPVRKALDNVLAATRNTANPCRVSFSLGDYEKMEAATKLLAPLMDLTNLLQSDGVTSSMIIPGVMGAYKEISAVDVGGNDDAADLQTSLLMRMRERFSSGLLEETTDAYQKLRLKRIVRDEIFQNKNLILASMLDPRFKAAPFKDTADVINKGCCSSLLATRTLEEQFESEPRCNIVCSPTSVDTSENTVKRKSLFKHLDHHKSKAGGAADDREERNEVQRYLELPYEDEQSNPLQFWKQNEQSFPVLAKLARIYLAIPASSGSVERLFSIAGALQRSRRARLKWTTLEQLLCYRELRLKQLNNLLFL